MGFWLMQEYKWHEPSREAIEAAFEKVLSVSYRTCAYVRVCVCVSPNFLAAALDALRTPDCPVFSRTHCMLVSCRMHDYGLQENSRTTFWPPGNACKCVHTHAHTHIHTHM